MFRQSYTRDLATWTAAVLTRTGRTGPCWLGDRDKLSPLLSDLLAADESQQLLTAAELVLCLNLEDKMLASAQFHLAALVLTEQAEAAPGHARTAARLDPNSVNRWVGVLAQHVTTHPELAVVIQPLATQPDRPDDTGGPAHKMPVFDAASETVMDTAYVSCLSLAVASR